MNGDVTVNNISNLNNTLNNISVIDDVNNFSSAAFKLDQSCLVDRRVDNVMVLDGDTLSRMSIKHIRNKILRVIDYCEVVLVCKASAKQK
jgi:hypothetical protein